MGKDPIRLKITEFLAGLPDIRAKFVRGNVTIHRRHPQLVPYPQVDLKPHGITKM
jgi:hypothetical protein